MPFIKHGDGKIVNVLKTEEQLTEEQKKSVKEAVDQTKTETDASAKKKLES